MLAACCSLAACSSSPGPTIGFEPTHVAELVVFARTPDGASLDSVGVHAEPVSEPPGAFGTMRVVLDRQGSGRISIARYAARVGVSEDDTVRFVVTAQSLKRALTQGLGGQPVPMQDTVLLTLRPRGVPVKADSLTFTFEPPA
jgi:hypothetical protein